MHLKTDNIEIMIYDNADEVIEDCFEKRCNIYHVELETSMMGNDFIFDCVNLLHYNVIKLILNVVDHI